MAFVCLCRHDFIVCHPRYLVFFFFNDTATTEIYTLSLHDALPISCIHASACATPACLFVCLFPLPDCFRSEEHTSELQSLTNLVCRLLLVKKKSIHKLAYTPDSTGQTCKCCYPISTPK